MIIEPIIAHTHSNRWWYAPLKLVCDLPSNTEEEEKKNRKEIKEKKTISIFSTCPTRLYVITTMF